MKLVIALLFVVSFGSAFGQPLTGLTFDGVDDYVEISAPLFGGVTTSDFTIECWFQSDQPTGTSAGLWGKHAYWQEANLSIYGSTFGAFYAYDAPQQYVTFSGPFPYAQSTWHHVAWCMNGNQMRLYLDGHLVESANTPGVINWASVAGTHRLASQIISGVYYYLSGSISEFRVSSVARYNIDFTPGCTQWANDEETELLYHFDEGTGSTLADQSGNQNNGIIHGDPEWITLPCVCDQHEPCLATPIPFIDNFDSPCLESCWNRINQNPNSLSLTERPDYLRLYTLPGNTNCSDSLNSVWRMRPVESNYVLTTMVIFNPQENYHEAGLRLFSAPQTELIYHRTFSAFDKIHLQVNLNSCGGSTNPNVFHSLSTDTTYLRLAVNGQSVRALHSSDGVDWTEDFSYSNVWLTDPDLHIGLFATNGGEDGLDADTIPADFAFFHVTTDENILPVELLSFSATPSNNRVTLNWSTGSESNVSHFEIDRDGATLARVEATNQASGHAYTWLDDDVTNGRSYNYTLTSVDLDGSRVVHGAVEATPHEAALPTELTLLQNYPNPFNASTTIEYSLPEATDISLKLFNLAGQEVAVLANGAHAAGRHVVSLNANDLASGIYFYRLESPMRSIQQKMVLLK